MSQKKKLELIDYFVLLVKWKKVIILTLLLTMVIGYLFVYFFIEEQYEASALVLPSQEQSYGGVSSLLQSIGNLPFDLGGNIQNTDINTYNTIIYSRSTLENVVNKFDLIKVYNLSPSLVNYKELALKRLSSSIDAAATPDFAYEIKVSSPNPKLSADMANYLVTLLNNTIIKLKVQKSKDNRIFLQNRINDIKANLTSVEDSMLAFQKKTGLLSAEDQVKALMGAYADLETDLITKQIELSIINKIQNESSPVAKNLQVEVKEYEDKIAELKTNKGNTGPLLPYNSLPKNIIDYYRIYRTIEIDNKILEFVTPLYEQAKFDEQKDIPVLQVIDQAYPPPKKSYPPRTIFTLVITFSVFVLLFFFILLKENENLMNSEKYLFIRHNLFRWKNLKK